MTDGRPDAIVTGCCGRVFALTPGDNTPNFSWLWRNEWEGGSPRGNPFATRIIPALHGLALGAGALDDLDGDGDLDLFAGVMAPSESRNRDPADRVIFNDGTGAFADSGQRLGDSDSTAVALGDVDGDGDLDALVGTEKGTAVWINQGRAQGGMEGSFAAAEHGIASGEVRTVFLSDLDGDGDADALIGERSRARIWWNEGRGRFTRSDQRFRYSKRHGLAIADFDGDGRPDIFAAAYEDDYRIWLNQGDGTFRRLPL